MLHSEKPKNTHTSGGMCPNGEGRNLFLEGVNPGNGNLAIVEEEAGCLQGGTKLDFHGGGGF